MIKSLCIGGWNILADYVLLKSCGPASAFLSICRNSWMWKFQNKDWFLCCWLFCQVPVLLFASSLLTGEYVSYSRNIVHKQILLLKNRDFLWLSNSPSILAKVEIFLRCKKKLDSQK